MVLDLVHIKRSICGAIFSCNSQLSLLFTSWKTPPRPGDIVSPFCLHRPWFCPNGTGIDTHSLPKSKHVKGISYCHSLQCTRQKMEMLTTSSNCQELSSNGASMTATYRWQTCFSFLFDTDSNITMKNVAIGPSRNETKNQAMPLRFFDWASPAFINASVPHPMAYEDCCVISASMIIFPALSSDSYISRSSCFETICFISSDRTHCAIRPQLLL